MRMIPQLLEARALRIPGLEVVGSRRSLGEEVVGVHMEQVVAARGMAVVEVENSDELVGVAMAEVGVANYSGLVVVETVMAEVVNYI